MATTIGGRLKHAWNAFASQEQTRDNQNYGSTMISSYGGRRPDRTWLRVSSEKSIVSSIYNQLGIDVAAVSMRHVRLDENQRYLATINSGLNNCLTLEANIDQGGSAFRQDIAMSLFDKGTIAIVPVDTSINPADTSGGYDILTMRVGEVVSWGSTHVVVDLWNVDTQRREHVKVSKSSVAIVENPLYTVMNETNSTLQRLIRKLALLDNADDSGKLDLIIQLPYVVKSDARREQAEQRRKDIEVQLVGAKYGVAYTDGTEKITQLNRPAENNLYKQVEDLTAKLYSQLGLTSAIFDGTADEATMINYHNRTIEPILRAIAEGMRRAFLTKTARTQGQSIEYFREPFKLVPISSLAEIADKLTRNEILTSNEFRGVIGFSPASDPNADKLMNKNLPEQVPTPEAKPTPRASVDLGELPVRTLDRSKSEPK